MRHPPDLPHAAVTDMLIRVFYDVYNDLEFGYLESVYEGAMAIALEDECCEVQRQPSIQVFFRGRPVGCFRIDFLIDGVVIVELKAVEQPRREHEAQLLNYLRASSTEVGLLLNFGPKPSFRRLINTPGRRARRRP